MTSSDYKLSFEEMLPFLVLNFLYFPLKVFHFRTGLGPRRGDAAPVLWWFSFVWVKTHILNLSMCVFVRVCVCTLLLPLFWGPVPTLNWSHEAIWAQWVRSGLSVLQSGRHWASVRVGVKNDPWTVVVSWWLTASMEQRLTLSNVWVVLGKVVNC